MELMNQAANILQSLCELTQCDAKLRELGKLPGSILGYYEGCTAHGKLGVVSVRRRVCGACHLSILRGRRLAIRL